MSEHRGLDAGFIVYDGMDQEAAYDAATRASCPACGHPIAVTEDESAVDCGACHQVWTATVRYREWQPARWIAWTPELRPVDSP